MKLEIRALKKSFGAKEILHGIGFEVVSGRAMGFLGRNGAGKTTTLRCIMDVFKQDSGEIFLDGRPINLKENRIGYLPEERGMYQKQGVLDQLSYFAELRGASSKEARASAKYWLEYFSLSEYQNKKLETLSKGNQQKVQITQAFLNDPEILILDEPFSGLDPVNSRVFKDAIRDFVFKGKLVIFSSHQMGYVEEICDDVTLIHEGEIILSGNLNQIKRERGENKLFLSPALPWKQGAEDRLRAAFPGLEIKPSSEGMILNTGTRYTQKDLFSYLVQNGLEVERFSLYTPSLNDIFIALAGGEKE